jgi:hypothetical protein
MSTGRYQEGDLFAVPLRDGGYGVGLAARAGGDGVVAGYFFGQRFDEPPQPAELGGLTRDEAVWVKSFGDLGLIEGAWPVLGQIPGWRRDEWPMPVFGRKDALTGRLLRVDYGDDDPNSSPRETAVSEEEFAQLAEDGLAGAGFVEKRLTRLLDQTA